MKKKILVLLTLGACQTTGKPPADGSLEWLAQEALQLEPETDYQDLTELRFSSTPTTEHLRSLQQLPRLTSLNIWDEGCFQAPPYPIGHMDDGTLAVIAEIEQLESLSIAGWNVFYTDDGLKHIAAMPRLAKLKVCMAPNVNDTSMRVLARMPQLTHLDISYTEITDTGLGYLLDAPRLVSVKYGWTQTQTDHARRFLEAHPQATFLVGFKAP